MLREEDGGEILIKGDIAGSARSAVDAVEHVLKFIIVGLEVDQDGLEDIDGIVLRRNGGIGQA